MYEITISLDGVIEKEKNMEENVEKKELELLEEERDNWQDCFIAALESSIPKQAIIELIENETIDIREFECIAVEDLQELLEENAYIIDVDKKILYYLKYNKNFMKGVD